MRTWWIAIAIGILGTGCSKDRTLAKYCRSSDDCAGPTSCGWELDKTLKSTDVGATCTMTCKTSEDCAAEFGDSHCLEGACVRDCRQDSDCPPQTYCIGRTHCGR